MQVPLLWPAKTVSGPLCQVSRKVKQWGIEEADREGPNDQSQLEDQETIRCSKGVQDLGARSKLFVGGHFCVRTPSTEQSVRATTHLCKSEPSSFKHQGHPEYRNYCEFTECEIPLC